MQAASRARRRRARVILIAAVAALVGLYATVVVLYAASGDVDVASGTGTPGAPGDVELLITPDGVDAAANRVSIGIDVSDPGVLGDDIALSEDVTVIIPAADASRTVTLRADELGGRQTVRLVVDGVVEQWPFDRYTVTTALVPLRAGESDAAADVEAEVVPYSLLWAGRVPGWDVTASGDVLDTLQTAEGAVRVQSVTITAVRSGATIAFGVVLLTLMVLLPVLALVAAVTVLRRRRKVEVTMLGWIGAMLFATIPLRSFLPGSPPIGSWVDYLIVLWVIAGLVVALALFVVAWLRFGPADTSTA